MKIQRAVQGAGVAGAVLATALLWAGSRVDEAPGPATRERSSALASVVVAGSTQPGRAAYDGVVQAVRQTTIAAQVAGAVVSVDVKAGDTVKAGQVLLRLDARAAEQTAAAGAAQARAAAAAFDAARRDFERQQLLLEKRYISQAAFDRAEAKYKTAQAEASAQLASAGAARAQSGFHVIRAPYAGVASEVPVVLGDMAMPGRPLVTVYDPSALRVSAAVPQTIAAQIAKDPFPAVEVPAAKARLAPTRVQWLPAVDPATHTQELRLDLPVGLAGIAPGMFARVWLSAGEAGEGARLVVPTRSVVRRAELTAVYVIGEQGRPALRQVRLGRAEGDRVEVLSGVSAGERVALDPQAAASAR